MSKRPEKTPDPLQLPLLDRAATRVVNIKREPGWKSDRRYVYIGRKRGVDPRLVEPGQLGALGNPFPVPVYKIDESLQLFDEYVRDRMRQERSFMWAVKRLEGKVLGCYCVKEDGSGKCHGKTYLAILNELKQGVFR